MGCVIGPLVVAGVSIEKKRISEFASIGARDSKTLTPSQRTRLAISIRAIAHNIATVELSPEQIDEVVLKGRKLRRLNYLEAIAMAKVIERLNPGIAYVDSSDVLTERFGRDIQELLSKRTKIISEHHADRNYPIVGAASIIAKVTRDQRIDELKNKHGDFGSGYAADSRTIHFLEGWSRTHGSFPAFVRKSWKTIANIERRVKQSRLSDASRC